MADYRARGRDICSSHWPEPDHQRIDRARADFCWGLRWYFPDWFYNEFTDDQREMISDIVHIAEHGGDQAEAASRGDGKTKIAEATIVLCICLGVLKFPVLFGATGPFAEQSLSNMKEEFELNDRLYADFACICDPIRQLEGAPSRSRSQTVDGIRTRMRWSGDGVSFPIVKKAPGWPQGSPASRAILKTRGLDGAIRGLSVGASRPDFAFIDDADTEESAESVLQQAKREKQIDRAVGGLPGPGKKFGRFLAGTLINRTCIAAKYTDPKIKPSWKGKRFRFLKQPPVREDLWAEYMRLRESGFDPNSDVEIGSAHKFYVENREAMDEGSVVSNPNRFNPLAFPPEASTLQHYYNEWADKGEGFVLTELQNDPPAEESATDSGLTPAVIQKRLSGLPMNVVPRGTRCVTAMIDVGQSKGCHYGVGAFAEGFRGCVVDYGVQEVHNIATLGPEKAVLGALRAWREERLAHPYVNEDGEPVRLDCGLIDSGDGQLESAVWDFVREAGLPFRASKGFGSKHDQSPFRQPPKRTADRVPGEHAYLSRIHGRGWLFCLDADYWKQFVHDRFLTAHVDEAHNLRPGSLSLFGDDERRHHAFARHQCAEVMEREFVRDKGWVSRFVVRNRNNDWLDVMAGLCASAAMHGIRLSTPSLTAPQARRRGARVTGGWPAAMQKGFA